MDGGIESKFTEDEVHNAAEALKKWIKQAGPTTSFKDWGHGQNLPPKIVDLLADSDMDALAAEMDSAIAEYEHHFTGLQRQELLHAAASAVLEGYVLRRSMIAMIEAASEKEQR